MNFVFPKKIRNPILDLKNGGSTYTQGQLIFSKYSMCFVDLEKAFDRLPRTDIEVGNEEERYTRGNGQSNDEFV